MVNHDLFGDDEEKIEITNLFSTLNLSPNRVNTMGKQTEIGNVKCPIWNLHQHLRLNCM